MRQLDEGNGLNKAAGPFFLVFKEQAVTDERSYR